MSEKSRIVVVYSLHKDFVKLLRGVRKHYPHAHITAVVPHDFELVAAEADVADELLHLAPATNPVARLRAFARAMAALRARGVDHLITQFESIKLRLSAVYVRPRTATCWLAGGRHMDLPLGYAATYLDLLRLRWRGYPKLLRILFRCYLLPIRPIR